jgi:hypothetical protein
MHNHRDTQAWMFDDSDFQAEGLEQPHLLGSWQESFYSIVYEGSRLVKRYIFTMSLQFFANTIVYWANCAEDDNA